MPTGIQLTAYADDLGVIVRADSTFELNRRASIAINRIERWLREHHLELAPNKTEAIILKGPRKREEVRFFVGGVRIPLSKEVKYLGVYLDTQGTFGAHVKHAIAKAEARVAALSRIMPNIGGPKTPKRLVLLGVVHSTILYGAPIWVGVLRINRYVKMLIAIQRRVLLRVACAYRTVAAQALQVITGTPPLDLLIRERASTWADGREPPPPTRNQARQVTRRAWQERWTSNVETSQWTKRLIPQLEAWLDCKHRWIDYYVTQFLTGHGSYRAFTKRIGKDQTEDCRYCGQVDTPEHTLFRCDRWERIRIRTWGEWRDQLTPDNIIGIMIRGKREWAVIVEGIRTIMLNKEKEEREFQAGNLPPLRDED